MLNYVKIFKRLPPRTQPLQPTPPHEIRFFPDADEARTLKEVTELRATGALVSVWRRPPSPGWVWIRSISEDELP